MAGGGSQTEEAVEGTIHAEALRGMHEDGRASLLRESVETELQTDSRGLRNLSAKDFPLANFDGGDRQEGRWLPELYMLMDRIRYPHPMSAAIGPMRVWASGGDQEALMPKDSVHAIEDEEFVWGAYSRVTRGEGMKQQETIGKSISESVLRKADDIKNKGLRGLRRGGG